MAATLHPNAHPMHGYGSVVVEGVECPVIAYHMEQTADVEEGADLYGYLAHKVKGQWLTIDVQYRNPVTGEPGECVLRLYFPRGDRP